MKTPLSLLALALAGSSCTPQSTAQDAAGQVETAPTGASAAAATSAATATTAAPLGAPLQNVDLSPAWEGAPIPAADRTPMEGYYGADFYRVSFLFTKVRRDSLRPEVYHVWGMNHYKKTITPFTGTCTVTRFAALPDTVGMANSRTRRGYTAFATYVLREDPTTKGAGVYAGQALLDFSVDARNQATQAQFEELDAGFGNPTEGGGLIFRGTWRNNATGQEKPACWAHGFATIMPDTLAKLGLGASDPTGIVALEKYGWKDGGIDDEKWWRPRAKSGQRR